MSDLADPVGPPGNRKQIFETEAVDRERMTTPHDFPELKNDLLLRAARGTPLLLPINRATDQNGIR